MVRLIDVALYIHPKRSDDAKKTWHNIRARCVFMRVCNCDASICTLQHAVRCLDYIYTDTTTLTHTVIANLLEQVMLCLISTLYALSICAPARNSLQPTSESGSLDLEMQV